MFGIGYATAEDRLFMIDALRHAGSGDLAGFAGGANLSMDESVWASEPYTDQDKQNQINYIASLPYGAQVIADVNNYVAGINAYIAKAESPLYRADDAPGRVRSYRPARRPCAVCADDLVSIATLVGGIFGNGGGDQLQNSLLYEDMRARFGAEPGALAGSPETPAAPHKKPKKPKKRKPKKPTHKPTSARKPKALDAASAAAKRQAAQKAQAAQEIQGQEAQAGQAQRPLGLCQLPQLRGSQRSRGADHGEAPLPLPDAAGPEPRRARHDCAARPQLGAVRQPCRRRERSLRQPRCRRTRRTHGGSREPASGSGPRPISVPRCSRFPRSMSNALLVSAAHSASGHALAVMGPQVSYYAPQILMEEDIHGPGVDADGAAFPGVNLYVELGHGQDYAWSATSAGQNIIDTFAVPLCTPAAAACRSAPTPTCSTVSAWRWRRSPGRSPGRRMSADQTPGRARSPCRPSAPPLAW